MKVIEYRGWKNNLLMTNGDVELIVTLDSNKLFFHPRYSITFIADSSGMKLLLHGAPSRETWCTKTNRAGNTLPNPGAQRVPFRLGPISSNSNPNASLEFVASQESHTR